MANLSPCRSLAPVKHRLAIAVAFALLAAVPVALADPAPATAAGVTSYSMADLDLPALGAVETARDDDHSLYLEVFFGERPSGLIAHLRERDGRLYSTPEELRALGLVVPDQAALDAEGLLPLDALPGLTYRYQQAEQRLVLNVPVDLRPRQILGYRAPEPVHAIRGSGLLLNYDAYARSTDDTDSLAVATAMRWFGRVGAVELTGISRAGSDAKSFERLDTRWTYSDPERMWTWTAGDLISGSLPWTRPVRLGGLQWRRNFGVRPDLITFPVPRFSGAATVPSAVELLVNNIQQFGTEVNDGPFVLDTFPHISGAGDATLLVRDALGRTTQTTVPIYVDFERLAPGLSDFSFEAGALRTGFGGGSNNYGKDLVFSGSWRRGMTDDFTLQAHAETGSDLRLLGLGGVWSPAGRWGVVTASIAHSTGLGNGSPRTLGYQWTGPDFGMDLQSQRLDSGFRDLGSPVESALATASVRAQDRASFWKPLPRGSLAFTWLRVRQDDGGRDRIGSLSWTQVLGANLSVSASVFNSRSSGSGVGLNFSLPLGRDRDLSLSIDHGDGRTQTVASLRQNSGYEGGWGYEVQAGDRQGGFGLVTANVRGRIGELSMGADRVQGRTGYFFQGAGSLIRMDGQVFASRRINDAFAVVTSNGVADVPILYENRVFGRTNAQGYLLLPDLRGWQNNRIAIDPDALGANFRLPALEQQVTPAANGAVLVQFPIVSLHPAMIRLLDPAGAPVPSGSRGSDSGSGASFLVGFDGEAYLEDLRAGSVLRLEIADAVCHYHLPASIPPSDAMIRLGPLPCERSTP